MIKTMRQDSFDELFALLKLVGGKFIIVEEGRPRAVLLSYDEFKELAAPAYEARLVKKLNDAEIANREIMQAQLQDLREEVIAEGFTVEPLD